MKNTIITNTKRQLLMLCAALCCAVMWGANPTAPDMSAVNETSYQLTVNSGANGVTSVTYFVDSTDEIPETGDTRQYSVIEGVEVSFTFTPSSEYSVGSVTVDGVDVTASLQPGMTSPTVKTYTLAPMSADVTVQVTYAKNYTDGEVFTAQTIEGVNMDFKVISAADMTCQVGDGSHSSIADGVTVVTVPSVVNGFTVTTVGSKAFWRGAFGALTTVTLPSTITSIGNNAFESCGALTAIVIPEAVTTIGDNAFLQCNDLASVTMPPTITYIGESAFKSTSSLTSIELPTSITTISAQAFYSSGLTSITIPEGVTSIGESAFNSCSSLATVNFPTSLLTIGKGAFSLNSALTAINLPSQLQTIGESAFVNCELVTSITIPASVTTIESWGLSIGNLKWVTVEGTTPPTITENSFSGGTTGYGVLYVQQDAIDTYHASEYWNVFNRIYAIGKHPYAVLDGNTLTFYCNDQRDTYAEPFELNFTSANNSPLYGHKDEIVNVVFDDSFADFTELTSTAYWFYDCGNLTSISGLEKVNTSKVTNMEYMFEGCRSLTSLDISNFDLSSVQTMSCMFRSCSGLTNINLGNFNASSTTSFSQMFQGCTSLETINISDANTSSATTMYAMFNGCRALTELNLGSFNTANVTDMYMMFANCNALKTIYVGSGWTTAAVTDNGTGMFSDCNNLEGGAGTTWASMAAAYVENCNNYQFAHIDGGTSNPGYLTDVADYGKVEEPYAVLSDENTVLTFYYDKQKEIRNGMGVGPFSSAENRGWNDNASSIISVVFNSSFANDTTLTSTSYWFSNMSKLTAIDGLQYLNTQNVTDMSSMFYFCSDLTNLDVINFNTANVTDMSSMFSSCSRLESLDLSGFNTQNVTNMGGMFSSCSYSLASLDLSGFNTQNVTNMAQMFAGCSGLTSLDLSNFNTENVTDMSYMFEDCSGLTSLDLSAFNTQNVTDMSFMFDGCRNLTNLDISGFNTQNVTSMFRMFFECYDLTSLDLTGFNTQNVTNMNSMFMHCSSLTSLDVTGFNTQNVTNMDYMFFCCEDLTSLDVSSFDTQNVTNMAHMFDACSGLTSLDISAFNTQNVTDMSHMFEACFSLTTIFADNLWSTAKVTNSYEMFYRSSKLVGGQGTTYDENHVGVAYAHIDGGPDNPGYFSELSRKNLTAGDYFEWDGMGANAQKVGDTPYPNCQYILGESAGVPYGDPNVNAYAYADLSAYDRLEVTAIEGTPRILLNRDSVDGLWNADESQSHLIESTQDGWSSKYFSSSNNVWTVDLKQLVADKGFAHLNAIKGANWGDVTITKMELIKDEESASPEPYAVLSDENTVLTFYYDKHKEQNNGMDVNFTDNTLRGWNSSASYITEVVFDPSFANCTTLTSTAWLFWSMGNLTTITGIENLKTDNVTNMHMMFNGCSKLTSLDVSSFKTDNVVGMYGMFSECTGLTSLDLSSFNTASATDMGSMFSGCNSLTSLDVSSFNTANVTNMAAMFMNCTGLTTLDLSSFNTAKVENMDNMFCQNSLTTIYVDGTKWSTAAVASSTSMFYMCPNLVGGKGTTYDANHVDASYAHIDGGMANPGYFTAKGGLADPLLARLYDNLALTTTDGNADGGNDDLSGSIDAAQTSLVRAMWNLQELPTDESYCVWMDAGIPALNTNTWSNSTQTDAMRGLYARLYHGIILANNYLANQHDGDMGKQAEARFLRALQYYYLMDHFGNVPLLTDTIDRQPLPVWEATPSDIELLTREEMFSYIENELQESLNSLPATNSYGRATATAARLLLARLYLNSEVYTGTARWQEARSYAESVINDGTFQLAPIYRNLFMGDNDSNGAQQEIILPAIYDGNTRTDYGGTTFLVASSFTNGEGDNGTTQVWAGNVSKPDFVNKFFTQTADIPYASPEQTASAAGDDRALFYGINHSYELRNGDSFSDGFPYQKFTNVRSNGTSPVSSKFADTDFPLMRLGEAYLIAAEADARLNGSATSMQGTQYINMLRNRANATTSTAGYSLSDICDEWSREMGYEAVRRTTLIRFGRFGGQTDYSWAWKGGSYDGTAFDAGMNTYPIPAVEVGSTPEPYVVLTDSNTVMTFYYDGQKATRVGIDINNSNLGDSPSPYGTATSAVFDASFANYYPTSTAYWFQNCSALTSISGVENLKTDNVTNMSEMFSDCSGLTALDVSGFKTANVTNMAAMFMNCTGLTTLDLSRFKTDSVAFMDNMFDDCTNLTTIYVGNEWSTAAVKDSSSVFNNCISLVGGQGTVYDANHVDASYAHIDGGPDNPGYFTRSGDAPYVAPEAYAVLSGDSITLTFYYDNQKESRGGRSFLSGTEVYWPNYVTGVTKVSFDESFADFSPTSTSSWFAGFNSLTSVEGMEYLNTEHVTSMISMFQYCENLTSLDLSRLQTGHVETMTNMFYGCKRLANLNLSGFSTANVTSLASMFYGCQSLTTIDLSSFNTSNVTRMEEMFQDCAGLTTLDLTNFNTENVENMTLMFAGCTNLATIYAGSGWSVAKAADSRQMFYDCTSLVGGQGTVYDAEYTDKTYAHIDGGTSNPGYLTLKLAMGDANGDGNINIADAVATVTNILGQPTEAAFYMYAADMNTDQVIDIFDVTLIVNAAFDAASPAPAMTRGSASNIMMEHVSMTADADYIYLGIDQPERFTATQFDVTLPEGMELVDARLASATTDHQLSFVKRGDNEYRVIGLSMSNTTFRSINGQLIKLEVSGSAVDSDVKMSNVLFVTPTATVMTSIDKCLNTAKAADDSLYDLKGQRLSNQQLGKGIYIMNHKKVIIK